MLDNRCPIKRIVEVGGRIIDDFKEAKGWDEKVDMLFNKLEDAKYELGKKVADKSPLAGEILSLSKHSREINEILDEFKSAKSRIYAQASRVKEYLAGLSEEDSKLLFRALDGEASAKESGNSLPLVREANEAENGVTLELGTSGGEASAKENANSFAFVHEASERSISQSDTSDGRKIKDGLSSSEKSENILRSDTSEGRKMGEKSENGLKAGGGASEASISHGDTSDGRKIKGELGKGEKLGSGELGSVEHIALSLPPHLRELYTKFRTLIDANARVLVEAGALREENLIKDYIKRYYKDAIDEGRAKMSLTHEKLHKRKDLSYDERVALNMLEDSSFAVANTLAAQRNQILKANVLKQFADKFGKDEAFEGAVRISDESVGGGVKKYGALAGKYVSADVAKALVDAEIVKKEMGVLERYYYPLIDHIKVNVTVKNPFTHLYNVGSNLMLSYLHGGFGGFKRCFKYDA